MSALPVRIDDVAFGGKGVGRGPGGKVIFVPFTIAGEEVRVRLVKEKKSFAEAELIAVESASPDRVPAPCPYFGRCGGCSYQHIAYPAQLAIKQRQVEQTLRRVGRLGAVPMEPIVASPEPYGYRNRIRVHAAEGVVGFYACDQHTLLDIEQCPIASPAVNLELRARRRRRLAEGDHTIEEGGRGYFRQTNGAVAELMLEHLESRLRRGQELLVDAYSGAGFFAHRLAPLFKRVAGIEENLVAVAQARRTAADNESFVAGDVAFHLGETLAASPSAHTTLLLDPPAAGISPRVSDTILARAPGEIFYVSCNPATLARDLAILCRTYELASVTPFDMFPQTAEIEVVARLSLPK